MTRYSLLFLGVVLLSAPAAAQTNRAKNAGPATRSKTNAIDAEAERVRKDRRTQAESMLISLAADAATYNDLTLRARTLARIADVLWGADAERARTLFRKAWDAAEVVDREELRRLEIDIRQEQAKGENAAVAGPSNIVGELLRIAARRDRALGEEFLAKITVDKEHDSTEANDRNHAV